jgi:hypothetical protein
LYETWEPGVEYKLGQTLIHNWTEGEGDSAVQHTSLYQINSTHTAQAHFPPHGPGLTALYDVAVNRDEEIAWVEPTSTRYFKLGDRMRYTDGLLYESLLAVNVYSPETYPQGWRLIEEVVEPDPEPEILDWVQPTGGHDAYQTGDKVRFNGSVYQSKINANVWSPTAYPAGWQEVV